MSDRVFLTIFCHISFLSRLEFHEGFPRGPQLQCPVFQGNKFEYIKLVPEITNPTLKVPMTLFTEFSEETTQSDSESDNDSKYFDDFVLENKTLIDAFLEKTIDIAADGWYMKGPYGQNRSTYRGKRVQSIEDILAELQRISRNSNQSRSAQYKITLYGLLRTDHCHHS